MFFVCANVDNFVEKLLTPGKISCNGKKVHIPEMNRLQWVDEQSVFVTFQCS
jgi:hypothetical protein